MNRRCIITRPKRSKKKLVKRSRINCESSEKPNLPSKNTNLGKNSKSEPIHERFERGIESKMFTSALATNPSRNPAQIAAKC